MLHLADLERVRVDGTVLKQRAQQAGKSVKRNFVTARGINNKT